MPSDDLQALIAMGYSMRCDSNLASDSARPHFQKNRVEHVFGVEGCWD